MADSYFERALEIYRALASPQGRAQTHFWIGMLRVKEERYQEAAQGFKEALDITRVLGDTAGELMCLEGLAVSAQQQGDHVQALSILSTALQMARQPKETIMESMNRRHLAALLTVDETESTATS